MFRIFSTADAKSDHDLFALVASNQLDAVKKAFTASRDKAKLYKTLLDKDGKSLLHIAVECGHAELVNFLLWQGFSINATDTNFPSKNLIVIAYQKMIDACEDQSKPKPRIEIFKAILEAHNDYQSLKAILRDKLGDVSLLYDMVTEGILDLVKLLIAKGFDINEKQLSTIMQYSPLDYAVEGSTRNQNRMNILKHIVETCADQLPEEYRRLTHMLVKRPPVGKIECYESRLEQFIIDETRFREQPDQDAVVLFFAQYDHPPNSEYHGAAKQYYNLNSTSHQQCYAYLAEHFIVFRVLINSTQQIEPILAHIRHKLLSAHQEIQHMMINGHASPTAMALGKEGRHYRLFANDEKDNDSAMKNSFKHLGKHATIAFAGCSTAADNCKENLPKCLSSPEIAEGRTVYGAPLLLGSVVYDIVIINKKKIPQPIFIDGERRHLAAYKNGERIKYDISPPLVRSRL